MKAGFLAIVVLFALAAAQPHNAHPRRHHHPAKRDDVEVVTEVDVVTALVAEEIVYVNTKGEPLSTSFAQMQVVATSSAPAGDTAVPAATAPSTAQDIPVPGPTSVSSPAQTSAPSEADSTPPAETPASAAPPTASSVASSAGSSSNNDPSGAGLGLSYSPYDNNGGCKSQAEISDEFSHMAGYGMVRIYGTDCDQTAKVLTAARAQNMKVFAGVNDITQTSSEIQKIIDAAAGNWDSIPLIAIGNELVNNGVASVDQVVSAIGTARAALKQANYPGRVTTVDTFIAMKNNPQLCQASDLATVNCHAFFDGSVTSDQAGNFVLQQAQEVSQACGGMETMISESGWPWQGVTNGKAVASVQDQQAAISSLRSKFSANLVLFTAFDELWKKSAAATFDAEQYWGILNKAT